MDQPKTGDEDRDRIVSEALRNRRKWEQTYRARALKLFPPVCGRCGREFSGKKLQELTVHHRDHNHDHNPPDGSNWELLCRYCHDNEHSRYEEAGYDAGRPAGEDERSDFTHRPFANLADLLKPKKQP